MPSARLSSNMNNLVRDSYQANGLVRSHQQPGTSSQTSLQKLPAPSPQFLYDLYASTNQQSQTSQHMQFPPPPPKMVPLVPQVNHSSKNDPSINSLIVPQMQQHQSHTINLSQTTIMPQNNGMISNVNNNTQSKILMSPVANKLSQNQQQQQTQYHQLQPPQQQQMQHYQQQQQQQQQQQPLPTVSIIQSQPHQQQVPMTTIMIPASAASQLQSASVQIQQAATQAMASNPNQPQILVFMIPYMISQPAPIVTTPEQGSVNSTLVRQSHSSGSLLRSSQPSLSAHSRAVSSLSNSKQEPEKFYVKANYSYQATRNKMELSFQRGDILHILDTLQNSDYEMQYWLATRVKSNGKDAEKGLIPDKNKAEGIALEQRTLEMSEPGGTIGITPGSGGVLSASVGRVNFLKRRAAQRSKSLCKDNWDNVVFDIGSFKLPVYERVVYKHPGFCRPVVIFGPLADVAREKLLKDYPEKYSYPTGFNQSHDHPKVIRLKGILDVIDQAKHALLDITPSAVEKLNYANLAPIVIFMKTDSKSIIKEFRSRAAKSLDPNARDEDTLRRDGKSSRKLLEQSIKLEKAWYHVFTAILNLSTMGSEMWYRKLRETIENQQSANVWMGERKADKKQPPNTNAVNDMILPMQSTQSSSSCVDSSSVLNERFNESLNIGSKSTIDLLPDGTYGNRSQLRSEYAHSLAQKLARASSEPKLNGLISDHDDDDDDEDEDDDIIKKPFPGEFENSSSVSSSNGNASYGHGSAIGSNMTYQHYPPQQAKSDMDLNRVQENIYSREPMISNNNNYGNGNSSNYHPLPHMANENGHHNQSMSNLSNNNVIDLSRNHETRGSAFQVYSDMNQNNYHYYNLNKI